jgi:hypothetical protein
MPWLYVVTYFFYIPLVSQSVGVLLVRSIHHFLYSAFEWFGRLQMNNSYLVCFELRVYICRGKVTYIVEAVLNVNELPC